MNENIKKAIESRDFETLFDLEIAALRERSCFTLTLRALEKQRKHVIERAQCSKFRKESIPFLPAIPRIHFGRHTLQWLITMVKVGDARGYSDLEPNLLKDFGEIPDQPYWIFDVDDGTRIKGMSPWIAYDMLKAHQRLPMTTTEIVSLCIIFDVLSTDRSIVATGSRFKGAHNPALQIFKGKPLLGLVTSRIGSYSPSCGSR